MAMVKHGFVSVDRDVDLYYQEAGEGPVILMVPGLTFSSDVFARQLSDLSDRYRVIALDPRGQGRSSKVLHGNTIPTHARDLGVFIDAMGLRSVHLVGWSFGALTTWSYVGGSARAIASHTAIDVPPKPLSADPGDWSEGPLDDVAMWHEKYFQDAETLRVFMRGYATDAMVQRALKEEELAWIVAQTWGTPPWIASALLASGLFCDLRPAVRASTERIPTMVWLAESWAATARPYMEKLAPKARIMVLGAHMMFWEHHEPFNAALHEFISKADQRAATDATGEAKDAIAW